MGATVKMEDKMGRRDSGRSGVARRLLMEAAQKAVETGEHIISFRCRSKSEAFNIRQSCYTFQRTWLVQLEEQAIMDGKDPQQVINETLMKATWPSASMRYALVDGVHWLIFDFKRIGTDPNWDDLFKTRLMAGEPSQQLKAPSELPQLNSDEIYQMLKETKR